MAHGGMFPEPMTEDEKRWQAESDARTLANSDVIKADPDRLQAAGTAAEKMAEDELQEAIAMKKVASLYTSMQNLQR